MALSRRGYRTELNVWPGWVDALSSLVIVVVFVLMVFVIAQAFLQQLLAGRDQSLAELNQRVAELDRMLGKERETTNRLQVEASIAATKLAEAVTEKNQAAESANASVTQVQALSQQIATLTMELQRLNDALGAAKAQSEAQTTTIAELTAKVNAALADKVNQLAKYRSEFFGRLRELLGDRSDIRVVGDRFVFQSEVLFPSGSAQLQEQGRTQLMTLAQTLLEIAKTIPPEINWVLRVDGHTDRRPIRTAEFPNNWVLSTARATAVVQYLIEQGVPPGRLAAAGFAEYQPVEAGDDDAALARNRRIELKFDQR